MLIYGLPLLIAVAVVLSIFKCASRTSAIGRTAGDCALRYVEIGKPWKCGNWAPNVKTSASKRLPDSADSREKRKTCVFAERRVKL